MKRYFQVKLLDGHQMGYRSFHEPDLDEQLTAVATQPLVEEQRSLFSRYRLLH